MSCAANCSGRAAAMSRSHPQLDDARAARDALTAARRGYHLALVIANDAGYQPEVIAECLGTSPLYVRNTLRAHRAKVCGCGAPTLGVQA